MLLTIHDAHLRQVASIDNDKQGTLNYFNDTWTSYLETGAATFDFTVSKKELATDTYSKRAYQFLNEKNFISFEYEGETQLFIVRKVVENEKLIKLNCVNLNLELINEYANPYKALKDMSFEEYCKALDLLNFTMLKIGVNEISDKKLTLEWEGQETKLARLLSLANKFGAEIEFKTFLNSNSSIKAFVVNVYHANDGFHQGVGKRQSKVLRYGRDFNSLTRTVDTTGIYNAILPTGNRTEVTSTKTSIIHNVDGSVTTTKKVRNPDGSVTTTSKRVRNDGFVLGQVVTKTVKNPDGTSSTTTEREMTTVYKKRTGRRRKAEEQPPFKVKHSKTSKTSAYSNDSTFDLSDLPDWKLENENGQVEFYKAGKMLYAPLSMQMFPAAFTSDTMSDQWIRRDATIDAETQEELSDKALDMLRKNCYPAVTYEVDGYLPYGVGDTVEIEDDGFALTLLLEMRVSERSISFTGTGQKRTVFANYRALENQLSSGIQQRLEEMLEEAKPYDIKVASDNGTVFKNNKGKSTIYPTLLKGEKTIPDSEVSWKWKVDEQDFPLAPTFTVEAAGLTKPLTVAVIAIVNGKEVAHKELAFTNVNDGAKGSDGKSITVAKAEKEADGVRVTFSDNKSIVVPKGDKGDKGDPAAPANLNALQEEMNQTKQGLSDVRTDLLKEKAESSAKIDQVKKDVGAIRNQQTIYEQSNEQNLSRITGQLADKASKSEVKQEAGEIREEISQISVGGRNLLKGSKGPFKPNTNPANFDNTVLYHNETSVYMVNGQRYLLSAKTDGIFASHHDGFKESDNVVLWIMDKAITNYQIVSDAKTGTTGTEFVWNRPTGIYHLRVNTYRKDPQKLKSVWEVKVEQGSFKTDWSPAPEDTEGLITEAKATFERTAQGLRTDLAAVQAYVSADGTRSEALRTYSREETARQLTAERKVIEAGYVAKTQHTEDVRGLTRRFEELTVGGRNLALGTSKEWSAPFTNFSGNPNIFHPLYKVLTDGLQVGDTLRSKIILKYTDVRPAAGKTATAELQGNGNVTGWTAGAYNNSPAKTLNGSGEITFEHSFKITENHLKNAYWNWMFRTDFIASGSLQWRLAKVESGSVFTNWSPAPEDATSYADTKLAEYKQDIDGQLAAVKQDVNGKVSQATFDQRANQITQSVQELNNNTVKKNQIKIDENGLVSSSEKTVNGQMLASMISQNPEWVEIIAKLLKIKADMIVNGAITADKLNIKELSALSSDLGEVSAGLINLQKHLEHVRNEDVWGTIENITCDKGTILSDKGIVSNGFPIRKAKGDVKPTVMPLVWLNSGELYFTNVDSEYDLRQIMLNGVYPFNRTGAGRIHFGKMEDGRDALYVDCGFSELYLKANNYTDWKQSTFNSGVRWKVQGGLVLVDFDLKYDKDGTYPLVGIPQQYVNGKKMFPVQAWSLDRNQDRTAQLNADGSLYIIGANKGVEYHGQIIWTY